MTSDKSSSEKKGYGKLGLFAVLICYSFDQITKWYVDSTLEVGQGVAVIPDFFDIIHVRNTGAAFGILQGMPESLRTPFFLVITVLACAMVFFMLRQISATSVFTRSSFYLIIAGALGNLTDRIRLHEVVDFLNFHIGRFYWPAFNLADVYITIGIVYLLIYTMVSGRKEESKE
jgi:signal peptidase II